MNVSSQLLEYSKNLSILVVEDHKELRENTVDILRNFFKIVDNAEDGVKGLALYQQYYQNNDTTYDIVLTDLRMPNLNGIELIKEIYTIDENQKIIVLSAHDESEYLLKLINMGIQQFIKKPIDFQNLTNTLLEYSKQLNSEKINQKIIHLKNGFDYDAITDTLTEYGESIYLTKYEIIFLNLLTQNVRKIYTNEEITKYYEMLEQSINSANIRKMVSKLRKKLPKESLESIYSVGYRLVPLS